MKLRRDRATKLRGQSLPFPPSVPDLEPPPTPQDATVRDVRRALAPFLGVEPGDVGHYAMIIECANGVHLKFCCDNRQATATMFREGARLILTKPGESLNGRPPPPMPTS